MTPVTIVRVVCGTYSTLLVHLDATIQKMNAYFHQLRNLGQKIDGDIKKLEKTWESPLLFISGYGQNVEEASPYIETFFGTLKEIQDELIENLNVRTKHITSTDKLLSDMEKLYTEFKKQYEDVEMLLSENGYQPSPESTEHSLTTESEVESSILALDQMGNTTLSSVTLSPVESKNSDLFITLRNQPKSIATPVIKSLASVMQTQ